MRHNAASHTPLILIIISDFFKKITITLLQTFLKVGVYKDTESKQASKETHTCPTSRLGDFKSKNE